MIHGSIESTPNASKLSDILLKNTDFSDCSSLFSKEGTHIKVSPIRFNFIIRPGIGGDLAF